MAPTFPSLQAEALTSLVTEQRWQTLFEASLPRRKSGASVSWGKTWALER